MPEKDLITTPNYTLYRGDCLQFMRDLQPGIFDAIITDPPYSSGGAFRGDRNAAGKTKYQNTGTMREYPEFQGDTRDQRSYFYWCSIWLGQGLQVTKPGSPICIFTDWRQLAATIDAVQVAGMVYRGVAPWNKTQGARPQRGRFTAQCEYTVWGSNGPMQEQTEKCLPGFFTYVVKPGEKEHITGKPVDLLVDILEVTGPNAVIFDPFMGSGTTAVACARTGRRFVGCEIDRENFEIARRRIENAYAQPVLVRAPQDTAQQVNLFSEG